MTGRRRMVERFSTDVLRSFERWLDSLPAFVLRELRYAVKNELLARDLAALAAESGGWPCVVDGGLQ